MASWQALFGKRMTYKTTGRIGGAGRSARSDAAWYGEHGAGNGISTALKQACTRPNRQANQFINEGVTLRHTITKLARFRKNLPGKMLKTLVSSLIGSS
jgi:hypothetical protein